MNKFIRVINELLQALVSMIIVTVCVIAVYIIYLVKTGRDINLDIFEPILNMIKYLF